MKKAIFAVIAACLGCCTVLFLIPVLSGVTLVGLGISGVRLEFLLCALPVVALLGFGIYIMLWPRKAKACAHDGSCGCKPQDTQAR